MSEYVFFKNQNQKSKKRRPKSFASCARTHDDGLPLPILDFTTVFIIIVYIIIKIQIQSLMITLATAETRTQQYKTSARCRCQMAVHFAHHSRTLADSTIAPYILNPYPPNQPCNPIVHRGAYLFHPHFQPHGFRYCVPAAACTRCTVRPRPKHHIQPDKCARLASPMPRPPRATTTRATTTQINIITTFFLPIVRLTQY